MNTGIISAQEKAKWLSVNPDALSLHRRELLLRRILKHDPASILDIGCGTGSDVVLLKVMRPDVIVSGLDQNETELLVAKEKLEKLGIEGVNLYSGDFMRTQDKETFPANSFDVVFSNAAIMYSPYARLLLERMYDIARKAVVMLELPTIDMEKALQDYRVTRKRVPYEDLDIVWRNFGFIMEIKK